MKLQIMKTKCFILASLLSAILLCSCEKEECWEFTTITYTYQPGKPANMDKGSFEQCNYTEKEANRYVKRYTETYYNSSGHRIEMVTTKKRIPAK